MNGTNFSPKSCESPLIRRMTIGGVDINSFTLVVQPDGLPCVRTAANELVEYLAKATGYTVPVTASNYEIVIGVTDRDTDTVRNARQRVKRDGYVLLMDGNRLYITGSCDRGTMYGVYCFLEDYLGVRFLAKDCTVIRKNPVVEIPSDVFTLHNPSFIHRDTFWYDMTTDQTWSNHCKDNAPEPDAPEIGCAYAFAGGPGGLAHTICYLAEIPYETGKQPCLSDENVYRTVVKNVRNRLKNSPHARFVSVSQSDSYPGQLGCQCEKCKAIDDREGTPMGSLLTFVNRVANEIKDEYPNIYVETLAYAYTVDPPKYLKPADNVLIRLCLWPCNACSFAEGTCKQAAYNRELLQKWSAIAPNLFIWTYTTNYYHYLMPYANLYQLWENVRFFKENNVIGMFVQGNHESISGEFGELRAYLISKLLWDPDMTKEEYYTHMDEFLEGYYGPGWKHIRAYIEEICTQVKENLHQEYVSGLPEALRGLPPPHSDDGTVDMDYGRKLMKYWEAAMAEATDSEHMAHLEKSSIQVHFYCGKLESSAEHRQITTDLMQKYGVTCWAERSPLPVWWEFQM